MSKGRVLTAAALILRILLGSVFAGNMMSLLYSLAGGLVCFEAMALSRDLSNLNMTWLVSVIGAIGHNIGQILIAVAMTNTVQIVWYLPVLMISAVITGLFTGLIAQYTLKRSHDIIYRIIGAEQ